MSKSIMWSTSRYTIWIWVTLATFTAVQNYRMKLRPTAYENS